MFDSDLNEDAARQKVTRRAFLLSGGMAAAAIAAWSSIVYDHAKEWASARN
jgi:hypothetical protein